MIDYLKAFDVTLDSICGGNNWYLAFRFLGNASNRGCKSQVFLLIKQSVNVNIRRQSIPKD